MNIYNLFHLNKTANSHEIFKKCQEYLLEWTFENVLHQLSKQMTTLQANVNIKKVLIEGEQYLKASASILLNPQSRQTYDAYLDCLLRPTNEKMTLTRARILWYNSNNDEVQFSKTMLTNIEETKVDNEIKENENPPKRHKKDNVKPICRQCRGHFDFNVDYLVLHCDCSTRAGHPECMNSFKERVNGKCPVCRKTLLVRYQISKYLFWQNKEKFKLIT
jgi:hypothetical protein